MKKISFLILFLLVVSSVSAYTHSATNVYLYMNGSERILSDAVNVLNFSKPYDGGFYSSPIILGHNASDVYVNVNGAIKSFQAAINDGNLSVAEVGGSPANYSGFNMIYGEFGTNVSVVINGVEKNLQQLINEGFFRVLPVCVPKTCPWLQYYGWQNYGFISDGCGGTVDCWDTATCYTNTWVCSEDTSFYYMSITKDNPSGTYCFAPFTITDNCYCNCPQGWTYYMVRSDTSWCGNDADWGIGCKLAK